MKISNEYEEKTLYITKHNWSREVVTFIINKEKYITTSISATDSKRLGLNDIYDKSTSVKKYILSPTNTKSLDNSYFNIFLTRNPSSQRTQKKIAAINRIM